MQPHTKVYFKYFGYGIDDKILCEVCQSKEFTSVANDLHHIRGRGKGKDVIENLIALCRECHNQAHSNKLSKEYLTETHKRNLESF